VNSSDARSGGAVLAPQHDDGGHCVRGALPHGRAPVDADAQDRLLAAPTARSFGPELSGSSGAETTRRSSSPVASPGIRAPRRHGAVQLNHIPERGVQRGVADRKAREAHAGSAAPKRSSGSHVAPTEGSQKCGSPGMETERATGGTSPRPLVGARCSLTSPASRSWTPGSPPTAVPRSGHSAHPSGWGSR